jgi:hypothetical protein
MQTSTTVSDAAVGTHTRRGHRRPDDRRLSPALHTGVRFASPRLASSAVPHRSLGLALARRRSAAAARGVPPAAPRAHPEASERTPTPRWRCPDPLGVWWARSTPYLHRVGPVSVCRLPPASRGLSVWADTAALARSRTHAHARTHARARAFWLNRIGPFSSVSFVSFVISQFQIWQFFDRGARPPEKIHHCYFISICICII